MMILITYDIDFQDGGGQKRLRNIAKTCEDYGVRAQYSVFECEVTPAQWVELKEKLLSIYDQNTDSIRVYKLGKNWRTKVEQFGVKKAPDILKDTLLL